MLRKLLHSFVISGIVIGLLSIFFFLGLFETWNNSLADKLFTKRPAHPDIVIVAIDNDSITKIGRWPWSRNVHADLVNKIAQEKPASIGIDISFLEPENADIDARLGAALANAGNVILAAEEDNGQVLTPLPQFARVAKAGIVNTKAGEDGVTRHLVFSSNHFSFQVAKTYLADGKLEEAPLEDDKYLRINFAGGPGTFPQYSFSDVLEGRVENVFRDKIVLVGATAPDLHDNQLVPTSGGTPMNGVEIQAHGLATLLEGKYLTPESQLATFVMTFLIILVITAILVFVRIIPGLFVVAIFTTGYLVYSILSFDAGIIRNLVFPILAIIASGIANIVYKYLSESSQKRFIKKAFSYYLSEAVLNEILTDPRKLKLGGARAELTVLFSDIAGFTSISEKVSPETLARMLNVYLTRMTNLVFENRGVLDKYIGDAVMAFWGAPLKERNHAYLACKTALEMVQELESIRELWQEEGVENFDIRIGINTGEMVVGNMGSHQRFDYTLLGDNVNLGSRLEGINKIYGTRIIMSESTYNEVKERVVARKLDKVAVKGKAVSITIYELRALGEPPLAEAQFLLEFEEARQLYEEGKFAKSLKFFTILSKKYEKDGPTKIYLDRIRILVKEKPRNWDGVYRAETK